VIGWEGNAWILLYGAAFSRFATISFPFPHSKSKQNSHRSEPSRSSIPLSKTNPQFPNLQGQFKMSDKNGSTLKENVDPAHVPSDFKGKGKAAADPETHDVSMEGEDSSSEEELDEVRSMRRLLLVSSN
jgi:hypothetical protein